MLNRIWKWKIQRGQLEDEFGHLKNGTLPSSDHRACPRLWTVFRQMLHDTLVVFQILYFVFSSDSNKIPFTELKKIYNGIHNECFFCLSIFVSFGPSVNGGNRVHTELYAYTCYDHYSKNITATLPLTSFKHCFHVSPILNRCFPPHSKCSHHLKLNSAEDCSQANPQL